MPSDQGRPHFRGKFSLAIIGEAGPQAHQQVYQELFRALFADFSRRSAHPRFVIPFSTLKRTKTGIDGIGSDGPYLLLTPRTSITAHPHFNTGLRQRGRGRCIACFFGFHAPVIATGIASCKPNDLGIFQANRVNTHETNSTTGHPGQRPTPQLPCARSRTRSQRSEKSVMH